MLFVIPMKMGISDVVPAKARDPRLHGDDSEVYPRESEGSPFTRGWQQIKNL